VGEAAGSGRAGVTSDPRALRVLIADDQALVRAGFRLVLERAAGIEVVGEAADGEEAVTRALELRADVVLMDVRMPRCDGIEATRRLTAHAAAQGTEGASQPHVLILTTFDLDEYVYEALRAGASGFLLKDCTTEELVHAVRVVGGGEALLAPSVTRRLIEEFARRPPAAAPQSPPREAAPSALATLTEREREVLALVARGQSNAEIAGHLVISEPTVKTHVAHILGKLELRNRVQAVVFAYDHGLTSPAE
jgi:DNA-binding NarL/FixJ family response regulator